MRVVNTRTVRWPLIVSLHRPAPATLARAAANM
jgi:hypothetical protein